MLEQQVDSLRESRADQQRRLRELEDTVHDLEPLLRDLKDSHERERWLLEENHRRMEEHHERTQQRWTWGEKIIAAAVGVGTLVTTAVTIAHYLT